MSSLVLRCSSDNQLFGPVHVTGREPVTPSRQFGSNIWRLWKKKIITFFLTMKKIDIFVPPFVPY